MARKEESVERRQTQRKGIEGQLRHWRSNEEFTSLGIFVEDSESCSPWRGNRTQSKSGPVKMGKDKAHTP